MTAGLVTLRDDRMHSGPFSGTALNEARGRREQDSASRAERRNAFRRRQAEVKADDRRHTLEERFEHRVVFLEAAINRLQLRRRLGPEGSEGGPERGQPLSFAYRVAR